MVRKPKFNLDALFALPWWIPAAVASALYMTFQWGIPALQLANPMYRMIEAILKPFGFVIEAACGILAAWLFYKQRISKSTKVVRLLEPHFDVPPPPARPKIHKVEAPESTPEESASEPLPSLSPAQTIRLSPWSLDLLRQIQCAQFAEFVAAYFRELSFRTETVPIGADEGKDIKLFEKGYAGVYAVVQCRACDRQKTGVRFIHELLGVMTHDKVPRGVYVATGDYPDVAIDFAKKHPIVLITGEMLVNDILSFSEDAKTRLLNVAREGGLEVKPVAAEAEAPEADLPRSAESAAPDSNVIDFELGNGDSPLWPKI